MMVEGKKIFWKLVFREKYDVSTFGNTIGTHNERETSDKSTPKKGNFLVYWGRSPKINFGHRSHELLDISPSGSTKKPLF
jgi:hypothetical protein